MSSKKSHKKTKHTGHPGRETRARKRAARRIVDPVEQDLSRRWRMARRSYREQGDGDMSGFLAVAAEMAAQEIQDVRDDLSGPEHKHALTTYLYGVWGDLVRSFDPNQSPVEILPGYEEWLKQSLKRRAELEQLDLLEDNLAFN